ncbi:septum formation inhibitor Maf [Lysobacter sp. Root667]|uniref:Maf family protein n=1 Tax=Lysobacter sp. Root667 TaxID=1736581 RepID=UPI0006F45699|nr:Maf family nucleotide pyrophosphatase [Lysobacter sp. Root667]KRA73044.1 septum formation inhibitor Maf [Lysobacter sp. Root667]
MSAPSPLVLASTSAYRRELLQRLRLPFDCARPQADETPRLGEPPPDLAVRLARAKAEDVAGRMPGAWVLGSDQVAEFDGRPIGKPGDRANAIAQLSAMSGREVRFQTALCLARADRAPQQALDLTVVRFRDLSLAEIERYVDAEQPYDCAGSFKSEGLGIALFEAIDSHDPSALIGLPLIATARLLRAAGYALP